jgi:hypothetical protein
LPLSCSFAITTLQLFSLALIQVAVEDCVWVVDVLSLCKVPAEDSLSHSLSHAEEQQRWTDFFRRLLCSPAIKLGYPLPSTQVPPSHTLMGFGSGFNIDSDLHTFEKAFPAVMAGLRGQMRSIVCLYKPLTRVGSLPCLVLKYSILMPIQMRAQRRQRDLRHSGRKTPSTPAPTTNETGTETRLLSRVFEGKPNTRMQTAASGEK